MTSLGSEVAWAASSLGNWAFSILPALNAYRQGETAAVAAALVVRMLPSALAAPYAAVLVNRHSRRSILLTSSRVPGRSGPPPPPGRT